MRTLLLVFVLLVSISLSAQPSPASPQVRADLTSALVGNWTGVLEYRDYSEPATSTRRVQLPTWLSIASSGGHLERHFVYDDGPDKTVESVDEVAVDPAAATYTETTSGKPAQTFSVTGYDTLKSGRGDLILLGSGIDNGQPSETRITLTIRRNLLSWLEEVRPAKSTGPFAFRHRYTFTRAEAPAH